VDTGPLCRQGQAGGKVPLMKKRDAVKFRSHLGGFNRSDVNRFILESDQKHTEELGKIKTELDVSRKETQEMVDSCSLLHAEKEQAVSEKEALLDEITALKAELNAEKAIAEALREKQKTLDFEIERLKKKRDEENTTYSRVRAKLGGIVDTEHSSEEIIHSAKLTAQRIIASTERDCEVKRANCEAAVIKVRNETEEEAEYIRRQLAKTANSFVAKISSSLTEGMEAYLGEINASVSEMESKVKVLLSEYGGTAGKMNDRIIYYENYFRDMYDEDRNRPGENERNDR